MAESTKSHKSVALIELFSDLIYVYAISRVTFLIEEPTDGIVSLISLGRYAVLTLVVLQAWLYMTNYVNRYGRWRWFEYAIATVNMAATVYVANTISSNWEGMHAAFNIGMLVMLLSVALLYFVQTRLREQDPAAARNSLSILGVVCLVYLLAIAAGALGVSSEVIIWIDVAAVLCGAFLPFFIRGHFDTSIIDWHHLVERFELLVIITFGEAVVGMTGYFDVSGFTIVPLMVFGVILLQFGSYVTQIHNLVEHHSQQRGLLLMFSHYFIVIAVNMMTVALKLPEEGHFEGWAITGMMVISLVMFYVALGANRRYYKEGVVASTAEKAVNVAGIVVGCVVVLASNADIYPFLTGTLIVAASNFGVLARRQLVHRGA